LEENVLAADTQSPADLLAAIEQAIEGDAER
jgi:hypothetical protein